MSGRPSRRPQTRLARLLGVVLAALVVVVLGAAPASAHNGFVSADPADGATVAQTPSAVVLTFGEPAVALGSQVLVTGPDGVASRGDAELVDATVRQQLVGGAPAGVYTVEWRVTSADGHPVEGRLTFTSTAPGAPRSDVPGVPLTPASEPSAAWPWVVLAVLLLAGAATVSVLTRRRRSPGSTPPRTGG